jgi:hypothetical protein
MRSVLKLAHLKGNLSLSADIEIDSRTPDIARSQVGCSPCRVGLIGLLLARPPPGCRKGTTPDRFLQTPLARDQQPSDMSGFPGRLGRCPPYLRRGHSPTRSGWLLWARAYVPRLYWEDLISPLKADWESASRSSKKLSRREPIPPFTFVTLGWVGAFPSIAPSVLDARPKRSHLMPVYGVIGQEVARVE